MTTINGAVGSTAALPSSVEPLETRAWTSRRFSSRLLGCLLIRLPAALVPAAPPFRAQQPSGLYRVRYTRVPPGSGASRD
jgi:hypothetical protein